MLKTRYAQAAAAVEAMGLTEINGRIAQYWLSLWGEDDLPPPRSAFNPSRAREHLPGLAIFERYGSGDLVCRLSGSAIDAAIGFQLQGCDMLSMLKDAERSLRIARYTDMAEGTVAAARTPYVTRAGKRGIVENINLPFRPNSEQGTCQFLLHSNVRPTQEDLIQRPAEWHAGIPKEYRALAFG